MDSVISELCYKGTLLQKNYREKMLRRGPSARHFCPSLVLAQPRKTCPCLTEGLLMGRKESNQTNKQIGKNDHYGLFSYNSFVKFHGTIT